MVEWQLDVELPPLPPKHLEASFSSLCIDGDLLLRLHPNGLCLVALAPTHPALLRAHGDGDGGAAAAATAADAEPRGEQEAPAPQQAAGGPRIELNQKLLDAEFRKGRGPLLQPDTILGRLIDGGGGTAHVVRCGVRGLLLEVNAGLQALRGDELLRALGGEYIAVLEPRAADSAALMARAAVQRAAAAEEVCDGGSSAGAAASAAEAAAAAAAGVEPAAAAPPLLAPAPLPAGTPV